MALQRTALRAKPRAKGNRGELEVINLLKKWGWTTARRNWQSGGQGGGDIVEGIPDVSIEVKRAEACRIWDWLAQCHAAAKPTDMPLLAFRRNNSQWYAAVPLEDLLDLLRERQG
jgi:hypothetical protein